ncbi:hypothetical protein MTO96_000427 [Rhipicephalus appendiculatus]
MPARFLKRPKPSDAGADADQKAPGSAATTDAQLKKVGSATAIASSKTTAGSSEGRKAPIAKPLAMVGQASARAAAVVPPEPMVPGVKASRTLPSNAALVPVAVERRWPSGAQPWPIPKSPERAFQSPAGELRPQPSHEQLASGKVPSVRFDRTKLLYEGADVAHVKCSSGAAPRHHSSKKHARIKRPSELPYLRLPKFTLAPLRIIGLLRPRASHPRKEPTLQELLQEARIKEQDRLNLDTKERERHLTVVVVVMMLFLYYLAFAVSAYYYELGDITPATPGGRRFPIEMLRSTVNGSSD